MTQGGRQSGFTIVELVVVIVLVSILAATVIPRISFTPYTARVAAEELLSAIRYAQSMSMNQSGADPYQVSITGTGFEVTQNGTAILHPAERTLGYTDDGWSSRGISTNTSSLVLSFNARGRPFVGGSPLTSRQTIQVEADSVGYSLLIEQLTGYARIQ